jgi:hypothetical protein
LLDKKLIDGQIATALLTGIVAETDRFSNAHTSPKTMSISAELMGLGANQQLVATKLEEPAPAPQPSTAPIARQEPAQSPVKSEETPQEKPVEDGILEIAHDDKSQPSLPEKPKPEVEAPRQEPAPEEKLEPIAPQIHIDEHGAMKSLEPELPALPPSSDLPPAISRHSERPKMVLEPPTMGGQLTAASGQFGQPGAGLGLPQLEEPSLSIPNQSGPAPITPPTGPIIVPPSNTGDDEQPSGGAAPSDSFLVGNQPPPPSLPYGESDQNNRPAPPGPDKTLTDIEKDVHSSHLTDFQPPAAPPQPFAPPTPLPPSDNMLPSIPSADSGSQGSPMFADDASTQPFQPGPPIAQDGTSQSTDVTSARDAVAQAINDSSTPVLEPIQAFNAQQVDLPLGGGSNGQAAASDAGPNTTSPTNFPSGSPSDNQVQQFAPLPNLSEPVSPLGQNNFGHDQNTNSNAPPPVPPPMMPPANPY